jgi:hypothetical protein
MPFLLLTPMHLAAILTRAAQNLWRVIVKSTSLFLLCTLLLSSDAWASETEMAFPPLSGRAFAFVNISVSPVEERDAGLQAVLALLGRPKPRQLTR